VAEFLRHCRRRGLGCVRIVHGKGLGSRQREPVLKGLLRKMAAAGRGAGVQPGGRPLRAAAAPCWYC